jgi:nitrite reductase/ring-hydroxylating ferredoxin subunit
VLLVCDGDALVAIGDVCSHAGGPLHEGTIEAGVVTCPWHGSRFRVADGTSVRSRATFPQPVYEVRVIDGLVEVRSGRR